MTPTNVKSKYIDFDEIKTVAAGRWCEIIPAVTTLPASTFDHRGEDAPCPLCGGKSVIWFPDRAEGVSQTGRIACRKCTGNKPTGDGIATVATFGGVSQAEAARAVAQYLGIDPKSTPREVDIIDQLCRDKHMPRSAFEQFAPKAASRGRKKVVRIPVYDASFNSRSHFDMAPGAKGWFKAGKGSAGMFFPGRQPVPGEQWLLVEGVKDAAALVGLGFSAAGLPRSDMPAAFARLFRDCDVIVIPDLDSAGQAGAQLTGGRLAGIAHSVWIVRLPGEVQQKGGDDCRDVLARDGGERLLRQSIEDAQAWEPARGAANEDDNRPEVLLTKNLSHITDQVIGHLADLGWESPWLPQRVREHLKVYHRGGVLVDVMRGSEAFRIRELPSSQLMMRISDACKLITEKQTPEGDIVKCEESAPKWLVDGIASRGHFGQIRELTGIIYAPAIRPDGSILQTPGHDAATGLLYCPAERFQTIKANPSREDAQQAAAALHEVVADFPFVDDADRSAWVALLLTQISRSAFHGCSPLFAVTATTRGSGKSLLVDAASIIAYGRPAARKTFPRCDDEMRKTITAIAIEAVPAVLLDNINHRLGGASLDAAITSEIWTDRLLGKSASTGELPLRTVWSATGNNLSLGDDIARRVLPIRLASSLEHPEEREDFAQRDLLQWVRWNRPRLATAALTLLRAYFAGGCPEQSGGAWGSFESWSRVVRGAIVWAGLPDPLTTRESAKSEDASAAIAAGLIGGLIEIDNSGEGLTARQIADRLNNPENRDRFIALREVAAEVAGSKNNMIDAQRLGYALRKYRGRVCNGFAIEKRTLRAKGTAWFAQPVGGDGGDTIFDHHHDHHHQKHSNFRGETAVGGDGGDTFPVYTREDVFNHANTDTHMHARTHARIRIGKPSPPSPPLPAKAPKSQGKTHVSSGGDDGGDAKSTCPPSPPSPPLFRGGGLDSGDSVYEVEL